MGAGGLKWLACLPRISTEQPNTAFLDLFTTNFTSLKLHVHVHLSPTLLLVLRIIDGKQERRQPATEIRF